MRKMVITATLIVEDGATPARVREYLRTILPMPWDANPIQMVTDLAASDADPHAATNDAPTIPM